MYDSQSWILVGKLLTPILGRGAYWPDVIDWVVLPVVLVVSMFVGASVGLFLPRSLLSSVVG